VLPGDTVGSLEEFVPGDYTYAREGMIFATTAGLVKVDPKTRSASVIPKTNAPVKLNHGDIVVGEDNRSQRQPGHSLPGLQEGP